MHVTAVIVDDHAGFRAMARRLLRDAGFDVVGEAADGAGALSAVAELRPGLVLLDVQLPDVDGFTVATDLAGCAPQTVVVLASVRGASDYGPGRTASCLARRFVTKAELSAEVLVRAVAGEA